MDIVPSKIYRAKLTPIMDANAANKAFKNTTTTTTTIAIATTNAQTGLVNAAAQPKKSTAIKTQTAKLSYTPMSARSLPKMAQKTSPKKVQQTSPKKLLDTTFTTHIELDKTISHENFHRQKLERLKEVEEIKSFIENLPKSTRKSTSDTPQNSAHSSRSREKQVDNVSLKSKSARKTTIIRSKSEVQASTTQQARDSARSVKPDTLGKRSKSVSALSTENDAKKQLYKKAETRRYMLEQRKNRRLASANANYAGEKKTAFEKEQIKKRLEELRNNTRKILNKNMQKKKSQPVIAVVEPKIINEVEKPTTVVEVPLKENKKHIGLLRKTETKDHSYSAINDLQLDKENVQLSKLNLKLTEALETHARGKNFDLQSPPIHLRTSGSLLSEKTSAQLRPANEANSNHSEITTSQIKSELPRWLKPSSVQIYPYNFLLALRRKLEAISHKTVEPAIKQEPVTKPPVVTKNQTTSMGDFLVENTAMSANAVENKSPQKEVSQSDGISNFSSISIHLPASNTVSEISSLKTECVNNKHKPTEEEEEDDDTTASSAVLSTERAASPLNVAAIEQLQLKSKIEQFLNDTPRSKAAQTGINPKKIAVLKEKLQKAIETQRKPAAPLVMYSSSSSARSQHTQSIKEEPLIIAKENEDLSVKHSHVNVERGDFIKKEEKSPNSTLGQEVEQVFRKHNYANASSGSLSESSLTYSNIGLVNYEIIYYF